MRTRNKAIYKNNLGLIQYQQDKKNGDYLTIFFKNMFKQTAYFIQ